jgi:hypothetical protein
VEASSPKALSKEDLVGKAGPVGGSALSILGALLVLVGFVMPWSSCGGYNLTGLDLATNGSDYGNATTSLLCLVPFFALGILGVSLVIIPAALLKKIPAIIKPVAALILPLLVMLACCPSVIFFAKIQSERGGSGNSGMGGYIQIEYGYWISIFGLFIALVGGLITLGTAGGSYLMQRKQPVAVGEADAAAVPEESVDAPPETPGDSSAS